MSNCSSEKVCGSYSLQDIDEMILVISNEVAKMSLSYHTNLRTRHKFDPLCNTRLVNKMRRLNTYSDALNFIKRQVIMGSGSCFSALEMQCLYEKIYSIVGKKCKASIESLTVDKSNLDSWLMKNPYCRSYEEWNKWANHVCAKLDLKLKVERQVNNFVLEISRRVVTPNLLLAISAVRQVNDYDLKLTRDDEEVVVDQALLMENTDSFNLSKKEYQTVVKKGLSYDIVKTIYDEGLSLEVEGGEVYIKTYLDRYNIDDFSGEVDPSFLKNFGMEATINKKDLLQDFE